MMTPVEPCPAIVIKQTEIDSVEIKISIHYSFT